MESHPETRRTAARRLRMEAAELAFNRVHPIHANNGDEFLYRDSKTNGITYAGSFTKGLPHDAQGFLVTEPGQLDPFNLFVQGIQSGDPKDFIRTPLGPPGFNPSVRPDSWKSRSAKSTLGKDDNAGADVRGWESAGAGHTFDLEGPDAQSVTMPPHPRLDSAELVGEMAELYLMALLRDVPFARMREGKGTARLAQAIELLNSLDWFQAKPADLGANERCRHRPLLTEQTVFRGITPGEQQGPYLSQFLLVGNEHLGRKGSKPHVRTDGYIQYGSIRIDQRVRVARPGKDYLTTFEAWWDVQNGADLRGLEEYEPGGKQGEAFRFIATPRDMATWVHYDALYEAYLNACLFMMAMGIPFDPGIPFQAADNVDKQQGFAQFGGPHILSLVTEVATRALKAVRYQKYNVHRRARPEAVGGLIDIWCRTKDSRANVVNQKLVPTFQGAKLGKHSLLEVIAAHNREQNKADDRKHDASASGDTFLLPMAFPEGSPMHPSYGAGHATVAGACVTILKAYFDHGYVLPFCYEPAEDGSRLEEVKDCPPLTVEHELNKLAANIAIGRNWAGVHYFSDYIESMRLGEQIALGILEEQKLTYRETFTMTVPLFDGTIVRI
ncbi:vanadium-dependent haloperoxidase [Archangium violaceum]|uniref:Bromoperoxidase n=1 Tax=Archangium violaceum Cb vi76 TaxID=1406225 RepID=A0A084SSH7_9BACT|nr:vanadium-dependent haloperoxidase [Archangium violaceum]KFA91412.1 hypothetical protein Q664_21580 [Archangium violaceum Cb vi76]